jgi:hypothetical protein
MPGACYTVSGDGCSIGKKEDSSTSPRWTSNVTATELQTLSIFIVSIATEADAPTAELDRDPNPKPDRDPDPYPRAEPDPYSDPDPTLLVLVLTRSNPLTMSENLQIQSHGWPLYGQA